MNALLPERAWRVAPLKRVDRLRYRPAPQGRLAQRDEMLEREPGDPSCPSQMALNRLIVSAVALALN